MAIFVEVKLLLSFIRRSYVAVIIVEGLFLNVLVCSCKHPVPQVNVCSGLNKSHRSHKSFKPGVIES